MGFGGFDVDNGDRAGWANVAVNAFAAETRNDPREQTVDVTNPDDQEQIDHADEVVSDLLCDLHHLADQWGLDWESMIARADLNHAEEVAEEKMEAES